MPEFLDKTDMDPWTMVMDKPGMSNNAHNLMSTATCTVPATMGRVPEFNKVIKGKVPETGQPIVSSSKTNVDPIDSVYDNATFRPKHMGELGERINHLVSTPLSHGEGPLNEVDEPVVYEEPTPPNPEREAPHQCPIFASQAPSEASGEYKQCIECNAEFVINNWDFSEMSAEET